MGHSKNSSKRDVYSNTILPQETRKIQNKQSNTRPKATKERTEELPHVRGQGWQWEELPASEARGSGREDQPHAVAARAQEGLEELSQVEGQEGRRWGDTPRPR